MSDDPWGSIGAAGLASDWDEDEKPAEAGTLTLEAWQAFRARQVTLDPPIFEQLGRFPAMHRLAEKLARQAEQAKIDLAIDALIERKGSLFRCP